MLNQVALVGRLTKDPEYRESPGVATFRMAVDRGGARREGAETADFIDVEAWNKTAEFVVNYLAKGRLISVAGRLKTSTWKAQDGSARSGFCVVAERINALDKRPVSAAAAAPDEQDASAPVGAGVATSPADDLDPRPLDRDDPFADD